MGFNAANGKVYFCSLSKSTIVSINTDIPDNLVSIGAPIADLVGGVAGIYVVSSENTAQASYLSITVVSEQLKEVLDAIGAGV